MAEQLPGDFSPPGISRNGIHMTSHDTVERLPLCAPKWYFTRREIEDLSPSRKDGIDFTEETQLRKLYCSFLHDLGLKLKVPQLTIATAMMLCHRFYLCQSHAKNDWQTIATVSMFLACKVEETPRLLVDVVIVAYEMIYRSDPATAQRIKKKDVYEKQKELILIGERLLLATIGFDLNIQHPYKPLVAALKRLNISHKDLTKVAWNFVNDWIRATLCLQYKPHFIAAGSLFLAAKFLHVKLPSERGKVWWMEFDVSPQQLEEVIQQMLMLLERNNRPVISSIHVKAMQATVAVKKAPSTGLQTHVLSGSITTGESKHEVNRDFGGDGKSTLNSQNIPPCEDSCFTRKGEVLQHSQTSDCGSSHSIVEDGDDRADVGEVQAKVVESSKMESCKIVSVAGELSKIDKDRIKEALKRKRRRSDGVVNEVLTAKDNDDDDWIVRELENGIEQEYASSTKKQRCLTAF